MTFMALIRTIPFFKRAQAQDSLTERVESLRPLIGCHPPSIANHEQLDVVEKRYAALLDEVNAVLNERPDDCSLLFTRGYLHSMGYNIDYPDAWEAATADFIAVLKNDPTYFPAAIELGNLWVHSHIGLAPKAEQLFRSAQHHYGEEPLEVAQRGLFYALYYQGKTVEALAQAAYLKAIWPLNRQYKVYTEMARAALTGDENSGDIERSAEEELSITHYKKIAGLPKARL